MRDPCTGKDRGVPHGTDPYGYLCDRDAVLRRLVERVGRPDPFHWFGDVAAAGTDFAALVLHITGQQISTSAAAAISGRLADAVHGRIDAVALLDLGPERLRDLGLSAAKASSLLDLARRNADGRLDLRSFGTLDDEQVLDLLTAVRGVGVWTGEMFLIHQLRRPDVLPAGDLGIRAAVRAEWALDALPSVPEVRTCGLAWTPWRTYAAALLWGSRATPSRF